MYKKRTNIVFYLAILISIIEIFIFLNFFKFPQSVVNESVYVYVFLMLVFVFILKKTSELEAKSVKEEVKIVYKNFDKEKADKEIIHKNTENKVEKIADNFVKEVGDFSTITELSDDILKKLSKYFEIVQGVFFVYGKIIKNYHIKVEDNDTNKVKLVFKDREEYYAYRISATYAYYTPENSEKIKNIHYQIGEGLPGQVAKDKKFMFIDTIPNGYITIVSGLGASTPKYLALFPIVKDDETIAIVEIASFSKFPEPADKIFTKIAEKLADKVAKLVKFAEPLTLDIVINEEKEQKK